MTYMTMPWHENPCPGSHEIYNFGRPFPGHHNLILRMSVLCLEVERRIFKEIHQFYPEITSPWGGVQEIYDFLSPYPTDATHQIWLKLAP